MRCHKCGEDKLYREFPRETLTENCKHALLHCLRCTTEYVEKNLSCSICMQTVATDSPKYEEYIYTLQTLFPDLESQAIPSTVEDVQSENEYIIVLAMSGETFRIQFNRAMTINELKNKIQEHFQIHPQQQRLLYQLRELQSFNDATLNDYSVKPSSTINLVIILYKIPESFDEVIFDLSWDFPTVNLVPVKDYLDASVLLYSRNSYQELLDWKRGKQYGGVVHSGDLKDDETNLSGHQKITVQIKSLPPHIDKIFFTLSAFQSKTISMFPNPRLRFFDARHPDDQLCDDSLTQAAHSQAVIMCSMCKTEEGKWHVLSLKTVCNGNAENYDPIKEAIGELITRGTS